MYAMQKTLEKSYKYNPRKSFILPIVPCIYEVYNINNSLLYIGKATDDQRFLGHHNRFNFYDYGANRILVTPCKLSELDRREKFGIKYRKPLLNERLQDPEWLKGIDYQRREELIKVKLKQLQKLIGSRQKTLILDNDDLAMLVDYVRSEHSRIENEGCEEENDFWQLRDKSWDLESLLCDLGSPLPGWE